MSATGVPIAEVRDSYGQWVSVLAMAGLPGEGVPCARLRIVNDDGDSAETVLDPAAIRELRRALGTFV